MEKKLYRDMDNKMLCGVCAGVLAYIIAALVIPEKPADAPDNSQNNTPNV